MAGQSVSFVIDLLHPSPYHHSLTLPKSCDHATGLCEEGNPPQSEIADW